MKLSLLVRIICVHPLCLAWYRINFYKFFSVLTDIDINTYDDSTLEAPSITSYRMNQDVLCVQPPSLRGMGSFRSTRETSNFSKRNVPNVHEIPFIKFRGE